MRTRLVLSSLVLCFISLLAVPANAQFNRKAQFQQPTDEELKMTSDPKAPGADAVYLNVEEDDNDPLHYRSFYFRIKVLTEKGKELATVELPYVNSVDHISNIKARTIHPDGKVVPLEDKTIEDVLAAKSKNVKIDRKVFNLPSVEVGSILEYQYEIDYSGMIYAPPQWDIQRKYSVRKAHYQFAPQGSFLPNGKAHLNVYNLGDTKQQLGDYKGRIISSLLWWYKLPEGSQVQTSSDGFYWLDVADIPPIPDEDWMPPIESVLLKVHFYYNYSANPQQFWGGEAKDWTKDVDHFAEPTSAIHDAVNKLITPADKDEDKARKLYAAVEALDNTDYSRKRTESEMKVLKINVAKRAEDTLNQKNGNSEDIAMLYMAMVRAAGLQAFAVKVVPRDKGFFDTSYMNFGQLRDTVVLVGIDGKAKLLDPGEKMCPFGTVNWRHSSASGFRQGTDGLGFANTPRQDYSKNTVDRAGDITVDAHGAVTGQIHIAMTGQEALQWRQTALRNDEAELKKQYDRTLENIVPQGVEGHIDHFVGLDDPDSPLVAVVNVSGSMGTATAKRLLLPGTFFEAREAVPFVKQEKRLMPIDMHYGDVVSEEITYHLPQGMRVEGAPADTRIPWAGHATYALKSVSQPGAVTVSRALSRAFDMLKADEYDALRGFYQKMAAADQQQLVLTTAAPAGSGN
jgi:hypothetical protein